MKILRIIYDWPPPWQGLGPHPYELTKAQLQLGHEIDILCGRWPKAGPVEKPAGVKMHPILREPFNGAIFFTSSVILFFKYLSFRRKNKVDIIHSHGHFAIWIYLYRFLLQRFFPWSKELKTPFVVHFHNIAKDRWEKMEKQGKEIKSMSKKFSWPMSVFSDRKSVETASACIFVSDENKAKAIELYGADKRRCFVVESGVNSTLFKRVSDIEREKSRKDLGLDRYDKVILNHGAMVERKNIHLLVESLEFLPDDYRLLLVGSGDSDYVLKLNEIIKDKKLMSRVIQVGYTPYPQTPISYQVSDIFVLPSSWEGLPKVVMQGLSCGVPCLVSGFKLSEDIDGLFYLKDKKPQSIAQEIRRILNSNPRVDIDKVTINYSWLKRAEGVEKVYDFAIKNYLV
ncbi:glycosyltransferase family 4 protein [Patescibacteria group bacterium]